MLESRQTIESHIITFETNCSVLCFIDCCHANCVITTMLYKLQWQFMSICSIASLIPTSIQLNVNPSSSSSISHKDIIRHHKAPYDLSYEYVSYELHNPWLTSLSLTIPSWLFQISKFTLMSPLFLPHPLLTKAEVCSATERLTKHPAKPSALHTATDLLSTEKNSTGRLSWTEFTGVAWAKNRRAIRRHWCYLASRWTFSRDGERLKKDDISILYTTWKTLSDLSFQCEVIHILS